MREYCQKCHYPITTCLCEHIQTFEVPQRLIVLQHPSEVSNAKNSARLVKLCLPQTEIHVGESEADFAELIQQLNPEHCAVLFPSGASKAIEKQILKRVDTFIFIDATWRKALKVWCLNPWLHKLPAFHFERPPAGQYPIRKAPQPGYLSTLEAINYIISRENPELKSPLMRVFHYFNQQFLSFRPEQH